MILGSAQGDLPAASAQGWIELLNCNWGVSRRIRSAVGARKRRESNAPNVGEIAIIQYIDSASSTIHQYPLQCHREWRYAQYVNTDIGGGKIFRSLRLADCIISSVNSDGGSAE
jgi:type VI secretion system secreted protein Hcp